VSPARRWITALNFLIALADCGNERPTASRIEAARNAEAATLVDRFCRGSFEGARLGVGQREEVAKKFRIAEILMDADASEHGWDTVMLIRGWRVVSANWSDQKQGKIGMAVDFEDLRFFSPGSEIELSQIKTTYTFRVRATGMD